jgi:tRNA nucleotidyltransferase (CCA-adding enzyme)
MSDYMFKLESHLSSDQSRVVSDVQTAASEASMNVFLTGGALRDMLGGYPILEIDFTVEGNALKLARAIAHKTRAEIVRLDENRKFAQIVFPGQVRASIGMAKLEKFTKPGVKPQVQPATIHEDLRGRDFTINAIALSLNAASRGLLLDPNNGVGDLEHKELRAVSNYTLYDDPVRLLRLQRFKVRLSFTIGDRTRMQYENAREAGLESKISPAALLDELRHIANEPNVADVIHVLDQEKLLTLFSPALAGSKLNLAGLQRLQKARQSIPFGVDLRLENFGLFLLILTEKLTPKEKQDMVRALGMEKAEVDQWQKLDARSKKLEKELKSAKLQRASRIYQAVSKAPGDQVLFLLLKSGERLVQDRIKNYLQKYLPSALEVTDREVAAAAVGLEPGTPKFQKAREEMILTRLDARPKKVVPPPPEETPVPVPGPPPHTSAFARK